MKILLVSLGTRGDMEPFLAVAELLKKVGHETVCLFPEQFRELALEGGHSFESLGPEFIEMLESEVGKTAMGGSATMLQKLKAYRKLQKDYALINKTVMQRQYDVLHRIGPDHCVYSGKSIYPVVWGIYNPGKAIFLSPIPHVLHPTHRYSHIGFNRNMGGFLNRLSFKIAHWVLTRTIFKNAQKLPGCKGLNKNAINKALFANKAFYTVSPSLFPRPLEWPDHVKILGYQERNKTLTWQPTAEILSFFERHPKVLLVTFGSMINPHPEEKTGTILRVLSQLQIPALINTAGKGLVAPDEYNRERFLFVDRIPYDWVFPKVYAVIHHGGSGTTHTALKYGCATMVIPHIIDQFYWNKVVAEKGAGPKGPSITQLSEKRLRPLIQEVWNNKNYKQNALEIAKSMAGEDFSSEIIEFVAGESVTQGKN